MKYGKELVSPDFFHVLVHFILKNMLSTKRRGRAYIYLCTSYLPVVPTRLLSEYWQGQSHPKAVGRDRQSAPVKATVHFTGPDQPRQRVPVYARQRDQMISK
jgi:hypothetical protein